MENGICYYKYTPHAVESRTIKNKKVTIYNYPIALYVKICEAEGIDDPSLHPFVLNRDYNVVYWVKPGGELRTKLTEGLPDPRWNENGMIFLENPDDHDEFLNLEVQRFNSKVDPGTSCGRVVVGRARIPLPNELYSEKSGHFTLVRAEEEGIKPEGHIILSMRLQEVRNTSP